MQLIAGDVNRPKYEEISFLLHGSPNSLVIEIKVVLLAYCSTKTRHSSKNEDLKDLGKCIPHGATSFSWLQVSSSMKVAVTSGGLDFSNYWTPRKKSKLKKSLQKSLIFEVPKLKKLSWTQLNQSIRGAIPYVCGGLYACSGLSGPVFSLGLFSRRQLQSRPPPCLILAAGGNVHS